MKIIESFGYALATVMGVFYILTLIEDIFKVEIIAKLGCGFIAIAAVAVFILIFVKVDWEEE